MKPDKQGSGFEGILVLVGKQEIAPDWCPSITLSPQRKKWAVLFFFRKFSPDGVDQLLHHHDVEELPPQNSSSFTYRVNGSEGLFRKFTFRGNFMTSDLQTKSDKSRIRDEEFITCEDLKLKEDGRYHNFLLNC